MQEEREQLTGHQIIVPFTQATAPALINLQADCQDGIFLAEDTEVVKGDEEYEVKGVDSAPIRGKGKARGRGRGRGKEAERGGSQEAKGRGRGKKMIDGEGEKAGKGEEGVRGKAKGRGKGRPITVVTTTTAPSVTDLVQDADGQILDAAGEFQECIASCVKHLTFYMYKYSSIYTIYRTPRTSPQRKSHEEQKKLELVV